MDLVKRFLKYVSFDTQSDETSTTSPSTAKQLELAKYLVNELKSIGLTDAFVDQYGIVYASLKGNVPDAKKIGLIAHMDTSPDCSGANIKPRLIVNYDGNDIQLSKDLVMSVKDFPCLKENVGEDIIVTDGTTLLGADDKAGIAIIVEAVYRIINDKKHKHGDIKIAFTPDEEVGRGTENFDVEFFDADYAYTLDGEAIHDINIETFNAASALVEIKGVSIHPGSGKGKLINASLLAMEFDALLPKDEIPYKTEGYEGFHHLAEMKGDVENATLAYIIRNHNGEILERQLKDFEEAAKKVNEKYGGEFVKVTTKHAYRNMKEKLLENYEVVERLEKAYQKTNEPYEFVAVRGGTDGAELTFRGLPCPNIADGGYNFHGRYEYCSVTQMRRLVKIITELLRAE